MGAVGLCAVLERLRARYRRRDGRIVGVRGRGVDRVNRGRLGPEGSLRLAGEQLRRSDSRAPHPRTASWSRRIGTRRWTASPNGRGSALRAGSGAIGFYTTGPAFHRGLLHAGARGARRDRHQSSRRQHEALHGNRRPGAERNVRFGRPAGSYADIEHCDTFFHVGINIAETQTVLWMRHLDRLHGPTGRARRHRPAATPAGARSGRPPGGQGRERTSRCSTALLHELIANDWVDRRVRGRAHRRVRCARASRRLIHARAGRARSAASPADDVRAAAESSARPAAALVRAPGRLPVAPGDGRGRPGQQHQSAARDDRQAGCGHPADERPAHRAEHARDWRQRRLAGFRNWQNAEHVAELAELWNVEPDADPALGAADARDADLPLRRAGLDRVSLVIGTNPAVSLPELARIRSIL